MNQQPGHILREGPFIGTDEPASGNIALLALLAPILISVPFMRDLYAGLGWPLALAGGFCGVLFLAPDRRASLARLDWAAAAVLAGLMLAFPDNRGLEFSASIGAGFICGWLSARPSTARLLGSPGLIPVISLGATLITVGLISRLIPLQPAEFCGLTPIRPKPFYFQWGLIYWPHLFALAAAGFCFATGRKSILYWGIPWVVALAAFFLTPPPPSQSASVTLPGFYIFGRLAVFMLPAFFIAPQLARSRLELVIYETLVLLFLLFPPPATGFFCHGLDPAVFWLVLSFWPIRRLFRKKIPAAPDVVPPTPSTAKAIIKCGRHSSSPNQAMWQGLPSCRLAAAHDDGPLTCPYGCLGFGDCRRVCPYQAISLEVTAFPVIDAAACRGCGRCAEVCPKGLIELIEGEARAFIPCLSQSGLKKNAAYCEHSCLGCGRCRKACPAGAISRDGPSGAMKIDQAICRAYGAACERVCTQVCPRKII